MTFSQTATAILLCFCCSIAVRAQSTTTSESPNESSSDTPGPMQEYLSRADDTYQWKKVREGEFGDVQYAELILQSQTWREIPWKHQLWVLRPPKVSQEKQAVLLIAGGRWRDKLEDPNHEVRIPGEARLLTDLAMRLEAPVAVLLQVPQQPMFGGMVEDQIISYTFQQFLLTGEPDWPLLLPMVKSAVRGMDAIQEFCKQEWSLSVEAFTVAGASKRGWTTWLVGANDPRVNSIAPMVIDMVNMAPQMNHQLAAWGAFSKQIGDYTARGLQFALKTPPGQKLASIVDPYAYRKSLTMPKLIINGTNDNYWPVDALNLYWDDLPDQKHALYVPNAGHGIRDVGRLLGAVAALHQDACGEASLPEATWEFEEQDDALQLTIDSDQPIKTCRIWLAETEERDFRDANWRPTPITPNSTEYRYELEIPTAGYAALFGEMIYEAKHYPLYLSTSVRVVGAARDGQSE